MPEVTLYAADEAAMLALGARLAEPVNMEILATAARQRQPCSPD